MNSQSFRSSESQDATQTNCKVCLLIHRFGRGQLLQWDGPDLVAPRRHPGCVRRQIRDAGESEGSHSCHRPHDKTIFRQNKVRKLLQSTDKEMSRRFTARSQSFRLGAESISHCPELQNLEAESPHRSYFWKEAEINNPPQIIILSTFQMMLVYKHCFMLCSLPYAHHHV